MKNILKYGIMAFTVGVAVTSCDDWTEPESVGVKFEDVTQKDPEGYAKYLENLRAYRKNGHKKVYAWYDNKASFSSQAHHVSAVPDSIDVLVLANPHLVSNELKAEMEKKRSETGMQMAYTVDYATIKKVWTSKQELATPENPAPEWGAFLADSLNIAYSYAGILGFDRIIAAYDGKAFSMLPDDEQNAYKADQAAFLNPLKSWVANNPGKGFDFIGIPANIDGVAFLADAGVVFLSESLSATNTTEFGYIIDRNKVEGVSADKFAVMAALPVLDANQASVGKWGDSYSSWKAAEWARGADVCALGLTNLADDYYDPNFTYKVCRTAIQILNPAAK